MLIRGSAGGQLPLLLIAAFLGAWAGDALGARLGIDLLRLGDFRIVAAAAVVMGRDRVRVDRGDPRPDEAERGPMTQPIAPSLIDRLTGGATAAQDDDPRAAQFVRGLALGALVGAAIAGSTIWQRRQSRRELPPDATSVNAGRPAISPPDAQP